MDAETFYRVSRDRAPVVAGRFGKRDPSHVGRLGKRHLQLVQLGIPFCEERFTVHDPALVQLVGACLDVSPRAVDFGVEQAVPVLKRPQRGTHDLTDGLVVAPLHE